MRKSFQFTLFASLLTLISSFNPAAARDLPQLTVATRADSTQPGGLPILLTLTVTNTGEEPYFYYLLLGSSYPRGSTFVAVITNESGKVREAQMGNDQRGPGSGGVSKLLRGQTINVPVYINPLVPGSYKIEVRCGNGISGAVIKMDQPTRVVVKNDADLAKKRDADLVARIRKGEAFAQYVAGTYPNRSLIDLLVQELLSNDSQIVERAASALLRVDKLPDGSVAVISKAINKHLAAVGQQENSNASIPRMLAVLAAKVGTDEALEPVIALARTKPVCEGVIIALGSFKQEKATKELQRFLQDENNQLQFRAAQRLAERKDAKALEVLLTVAHDSKSRWRMYSFDALLKYADDQRVESAIKSGLDAPDSQVRQSAEFALRQLASKKK
jgi:HEAT repeat protein